MACVIYCAYNPSHYGLLEKTIRWYDKDDYYKVVLQIVDSFNVASYNYDIFDIDLNDCTTELLRSFNRYQESRRNWRNQGGQWFLSDDPYTEDWDDEKKKKVTHDLAQCIKNGGCALGVYHQDKLIGFASFHVKPFGSSQQYSGLSYMHVSNAFRGQGIGKRLFTVVCERARHYGIKKLYISANPAEDSIAFYRKVGCMDASEVNQTIQEKAPFDCQLEYDLHCT